MFYVKHRHVEGFPEEVFPTTFHQGLWYGTWYIHFTIEVEMVLDLINFSFCLIYDWKEKKVLKEFQAVSACNILHEKA